MGTRLTRMQTRSAAALKPQDFTYALEDALLQIKTEVEQVCAANARTERKVESFTEYLETTKAGFSHPACMRYSQY